MGGCLYRGTRAELRGCANDVHNIEKLLKHTFGWKDDCIRILTCDSKFKPTRKNIEENMKWLVHAAKPGDALFFSFSGHGAEKPDPNGYEENGMNETILPVDFDKAGMIIDDEIHHAIVEPLPEGVRLTAILDCCHSGTGMDLPYRLSKRQGWREETNPFHSPSDVQMFSGCTDEGTSADVKAMYGAAGGALTIAFCEALRKDKRPGYVELMKALYRGLREKKLEQRPLLTSTQKFDLDKRHFSLDEAIPNTNPKLGRIVRKKFKPKPCPMFARTPIAQELDAHGLLQGLGIVLGPGVSVVVEHTVIRREIVG